MVSEQVSVRFLKSRSKGIVVYTESIMDSGLQVFRKLKFWKMGIQRMQSEIIPILSASMMIDFCDKIAVCEFMLKPSQ